MKKRIINLSLTCLIGLLMAVGVARASGIFYFDSAKTELVVNSNLRVNNTANANIFLKQLDSPIGEALNITALQDLQLRVGKDSSAAPSTFNFALNDNLNNQIFRIGNSGNLEISGNNDRLGSLFIDSAATTLGLKSIGELGLSAADSTGAGGKGQIIFNGNLINVGTWSNAIDQIEGNGFAWNNANLFGHRADGLAGFYWANGTNSTILDGDGNLHLLGDLYSKGSKVNGVNISKIVSTSGSSVKPNLEDYTKGFGGMFSVSYYAGVIQHYVGSVLISTDADYNPYHNGDFLQGLDQGLCYSFGKGNDTGIANPFTSGCTCPQTYTASPMLHWPLETVYIGGSPEYRAGYIDLYACTKS